MEGARRGHGQYPEDATPKCIFLTTCLLGFFAQMRRSTGKGVAETPLPDQGNGIIGLGVFVPLDYLIRKHGNRCGSKPPFNPVSGPAGRLGVRL